MSHSSPNLKPVALIVGIAVVAVVAYLSLHHKPSTRTADAGVAGAASAAMRFTAKDALKTVVGKIDYEHGAVSSHGVAGVLVFGPYQKVAAGNYSVSWIGSVDSDSAPRFEATSMKSGVMAYAVPALHKSPSGSTLHTLSLRIAQPVDDAEFRVLVSGSDAVGIEAVELKPLAPVP